RTVDMSISPRTRATATLSPSISTSTPNRAPTATCPPCLITGASPCVAARGLPHGGRAVSRARLHARASRLAVDLEPDPVQVAALDPPTIGERLDDVQAPAPRAEAPRPPCVMVRREAVPAVAHLD